MKQLMIIVAALLMAVGYTNAQRMWKERLEYYISFYEKLKQQLALSGEILL